MILRFMRLDLTAHLANGILNLALSRAKGMLDRNRDVLVLGCIAMRFGDENVFMLRHRNTKIDLEQIALPMPRLRRDNRYVAARDSAVEFFQLSGVLFDFGPNGLRRFGILKSDIKRHLHLVSLYIELYCIRGSFPANSTLGRCDANHIIRVMSSPSKNQLSSDGLMEAGNWPFGCGVKSPLRA